MTNLETNEKSATVAEQGAHAAPEKAASKKGARSKKAAPKAKKLAKPGKKAAAKLARTKANAPRPGSKGAKILQLIAQAKGATLSQIRKATGWQAHSVRGFLSVAGRKHGVTIKSTKTDVGDRVYRIAK